MASDYKKRETDERILLHAREIRCQPHREIEHLANVGHTLSAQRYEWSRISCVMDG